MNKHVVSLDLAKQLKEAGYPQESEFCWYSHRHPNINGGKFYDTLEWGHAYEGDYDTYNLLAAAPLANELLEQLPYYIEQGTGYYLNCTKAGEGMYICFYRADNDEHTPVMNMKSFGGGSLPDALAEMWLYLKKENLL